MPRRADPKMDAKIVRLIKIECIVLRMAHSATTKEDWWLGIHTVSVTNGERELAKFLECTEMWVREEYAVVFAPTRLLMGAPPAALLAD
jgi:hypothetical protein